MYKDNIYALATPFFKSSVAIVRISGNNLVDNIIKKLTNLTTLKPLTFKLVELKYQDKLIDKCLIVYFPYGKSYTGEEVLEFHLHGSKAVIKKIIEVLSSMDNFRLALPGEFTKRALENNKIDLIEAEGINLLINSETYIQQDQALKSVTKSVSYQYKFFFDIIKNNLALIEASIDFSEEDLPDNLLNDINKDIFELSEKIKKELSNYSGAKKLQEGIKISIIGSPNVGKSSLINYLSNENIAIVSEIEGTTRDVISTNLDMFGYSVKINDTAGIRNNYSDLIEKEGIKKALALADNSDLNIIVFDVDKVFTDFDNFKNFIDENSIVIINKSDLVNDEQNIQALIREKLPNKTLLVSIEKNINLSNLEELLKQSFQNITKSTEDPIVTNERHKRILTLALKDLNNFLQDKDLVLKAYYLRSAMNCFGEILGYNNVEDILDIVFSKFCIGK